MFCAQKHLEPTDGGFFFARALEQMKVELTLLAENRIAISIHNNANRELRLRIRYLAGRYLLRSDIAAHSCQIARTWCPRNKHALCFNVWVPPMQLASIQYTLIGSRPMHTLKVRRWHRAHRVVITKRVGL